MSIQAVEDDLIATIKALLGNRIRTVDSLPGDWDADMLRRLLRLCPAVLIVFAGGAPAAPGGSLAYLNANWVVYAVTANASGEAARRRGDAQQIGAYDILQLVVPKLHGHLVAGVGSLNFVRVENLFNASVEKQGLAVYAATFQLGMSLPADIDLSTLTPFVTFDALYDTPPLAGEAEYLSWLAGDFSTDKPAAEDTVLPPQT